MSLSPLFFNEMPRELAFHRFHMAEILPISSQTTRVSVVYLYTPTCWTTVTPAYSYTHNFFHDRTDELDTNLERTRSYIPEFCSLFIHTYIVPGHIL